MNEIVFLASGGGGNLTFLHAAMKRYLPNEFAVTSVISDRDCKALKLAKRIGLSTQRIEYSRGSPTLLIALKKLDPDYVVTNIHKILDKSIISEYEGRLINLHYSLLPAFGGVIGTVPVKLALESGAKFIGTTVHHVTVDVDAGPIISQSVVPVISREPFDTLMERVYRAGAINLFNGLRLLEGHPIVRAGQSNGLMFISPPTEMDKEWFSEQFWITLRKLNDL